jgi:septal ring factor EnvC (AmiA/AmiB activator)
MAGLYLMVDIFLFKLILVHVFVLADVKHEERDEKIERIVEENKKKDEEIKRIVKENKKKDEEIKRVVKENKKKDEEIKRKDEELKRKDEEIKRKEEEINRGNIELKKHLAETDEILKKEIYRISKSAWHDFVGEGFEIDNGVLGLDRDVYLSIVKFLDSSILRKV